MSSREERNDLELERLFKSMDEIKASDELKSSTLDVIFGRLDEEADSAEVGEEPASLEEARKTTRPALTLVTDDVVCDDGTVVSEDVAADIREEATDEKADASTAPVPTSAPAETGETKEPARPRRRGFNIKVAAALLVVAVGLGGVLSFAIPASHVVVYAGETTFDLGVNVYGATVSATADSDTGKAAISTAEVRNVGFEEAFGRLINAYDQQRDGEQDEVQVAVHDPFGGGERFANEAGRVLEGRGPARPRPTEPGESGSGREEPVPADPGQAEPGQGQAGPGLGQAEPAEPPAQDAGPGDVGRPEGDGGLAPARDVSGDAGAGAGGGLVAEGELGDGSEPSARGDVSAGEGGQEPSGGSMSDGGVEGSLGSVNEQPDTPGGDSAPQSGQGQGQGLGGAPR